jgi:hypothetical protein
MCSLQYNLKRSQAVPHKTVPTVLSRLTVAALAVLTATCSTPTKPNPPVVDLAIQSVSPTAGPATGGTELTIRGAGFAAGTAVTIGGRAATDVTVRSADMLTAKTPASTTAGPSDIVVTLNGRTQTLAGGFRYDPIAPNTAPVITSITAQGRRLRQPASFADYGETIQLTLVIQDAETPPAQLTYQWRACDGTFAGTGPQVDWTAPAIGSLPSTCTIDVTVTDGPHVLTRSIVVRLHNSIAEIGALAQLFLDEFANSTIPAATVVRNFSDSCPGRVDELAEVTKNREELTINSHVYGTPNVTVAFGGACASGTRRKNGDDACILTPVQWNSTRKLDGALEVAKGTSLVTGVYRDSRWSLCSSLYNGNSTLGLQHLY